MRSALTVLLAVVASTGCVEELDVLGAAEGPADAGVQMDAGEPDAAGLDAGPRDAGGPVDQAPGRTLSAGDAHTCAIVGGTLWCWGGNGDGQLGMGDSDARHAPAVVGTASDWTQIQAGAAHGCGARGDGSLWCWGSNADGQLGLGDTDPRVAPAEVTFPASLYLLETSQHHTCALDGDRALWCWGENGEGEIGLDDWPPVFVLEPTRLEGSSGWSDVSTGQGHTLGIRGGALYGWGRNTAFQLGLGPGSPPQRRAPTFVQDGPYREVSAGQNHSCAIDASDDLWCWGENLSAQLGTGDRTTRESPVRVDGSGDWATVDVDTFHTCGLRRPGTLWCWGRNIEGQLGTADIDDRTTPTQIGAFADWIAVAVGRFHTCAQRADETVWCTGENFDGRLGTGDTERRNELTQVDVVR